MIRCKYCKRGFDNIKLRTSFRIRNGKKCLRKDKYEVKFCSDKCKEEYMRKIKFAVVGFGHIGKRHAEMINRNPEAELVAIVDKLPAAQLNGNTYEVPLYNDINELFKNVPGSVITSTAIVSSLPVSNLTSPGKEPINIKVFDKKQDQTTNLVIKELRVKLQIKRIPDNQCAQYLTQNLKSPISISAFS